MITRKVGPALAAGCTVVVKPAPETPFSALALVELAQRAGVPDGVFNVVTTHENVRQVGTELCENKIVKKVTFTGSTAVAKLLYKQSAGTMKKCVLRSVYLLRASAYISRVFRIGYLSKREVTLHL
jgi:succinate-semialdehyde dehydrogenase / glutarate-semialdehyde dehydrogenase